MKADIICFSQTGMETALEIEKGLAGEGECTLWVKSKYAGQDERFRKTELRLPQWTAEHWDRDLLIYVGALGIAVRGIAGCVASKVTDPAVVVLDERKNFCIPLLSGHLGGANAWALKIAEITGSIPVVTTATDVNRRFAVDVFAKANGLVIDSMVLAKEVSAALLAQHTIGVYSELPIAEETLPQGLCRITDAREAEQYPLGIYIGVHRRSDLFAKTLQLIPHVLCLGMGCKKETEPARVQELLEEVLDTAQLDRRALCSLSSIDIKKEEKALCALAERENLPFLCYSAGELQQVPGEFTPSAFVSSITGVDNVCERSAVLSADGGELLVKKTSRSGVTAAVAMINRRIHFE